LENIKKEKEEGNDKVKENYEADIKKLEHKNEKLDKEISALKLEVLNNTHDESKKGKIKAEFETENAKLKSKVKKTRKESEKL